MTDSWQDSPVPKLRKGVLLRTEDFGFLVFNPVRDTVLQTNFAGAEIFRRCDGCRTISEISKSFSRKFEVKEEIALRDIKAFLLELAELNLVEYV